MDSREGMDAEGNKGERGVVRHWYVGIMHVEMGGMFCGKGQLTRWVGRVLWGRAWTGGWWGW